MTAAISDIAYRAIAALVVFVFVVFIVCIAIAATIAVIQERKIWKPKALPSLSVIGQIKVFWFNVLWMLLCLVGSILVCLKWILTFGTSDIAKEANRGVEDTAARVVIHCFIGKVQVTGKENLPKEDIVPAPVYICNHASQLDAAAVYFLDRRFKWIAKKSILYLPGVGLAIYLAQHVLINRKTGKNGKSVTNLFDKSNEAVMAGLPMFFFPQGTRRIAERLPAKDGAFIVAQTAGSTLVPISIELPMEVWNSLYPFNLLWGGKRPVVKLTVHECIPVTGKEDRQELKQQCMDQIYSVLPEYAADESVKDK